MTAQTATPCPEVPEIGRYQMIMEDGLWLLDNATGDTWSWECLQRSEPDKTTGFTRCTGDYDWVSKAK